MKRCEWADLIKGICAVLVILMHSVKPTFFSRLCVPVFLPVFFFVPGYLYKTESKILNTAYRQLKLFVLYGITFIVFTYAYMGRFPGVNPFIGMILQHSTSEKYPEAILWFVPCMIGCRLLFTVLYRIAKTEKNFILMEISAFVVGALYISIIRINIPWHIEKVFYLQIFMLLGYLFKQYEDRLVQIERKLLIVFSSLYLILVLVFPMDADLNTLYFTSFARYTAQSLVGTISLVLLSRTICGSMCTGGTENLILYRTKFDILLRV